MLRIVVTSIFVVCLAIAGLVAWWERTNPTYAYRFQLGLEVEANGVQRVGTGVIEVRATDHRVGFSETRGIKSRVRGDAAFVELGEHRNVIATLSFGPDGKTDRIARLPFLAFAQTHPDLRIADLPKLTERRTLSGDLIPTLVTFSNLADSASARIVRPDQFEEVLGPDVHFKQAFIQMLPDASKAQPRLPNAEANEQPSGIEAKLPWWKGPLPWLRPSGGGYVDTREAGFKWHREDFKREEF